jgi:hypothetical protein
VSIEGEDTTPPSAGERLIIGSATTSTTKYFLVKSEIRGVSIKGSSGSCLCRVRFVSREGNTIYVSYITVFQGWIKALINKYIHLELDPQNYEGAMWCEVYLHCIGSQSGVPKVLISVMEKKA